MKKSKTKKISAADFDVAFEQEDVIPHLDLKSVKACYPTQHHHVGKMTNVDFPYQIDNNKKPG